MHLQINQPCPSKVTLSEFRGCIKPQADVQCTQGEVLVFCRFEVVEKERVLVSKLVVRLKPERLRATGMRTWPQKLPRAGERHRNVELSTWVRISEISDLRWQAEVEM